MNLEIIETNNSTFIEVTWGKINIDEIASLMQSSNIKKLSFNSARGFTEPNLDFLKELNQKVTIEEISIGVGLFIISEIQNLTKLKKMVIGRENVESFDFSKLDSLVSFWGFWSKNISSINKCKNIEELTLLKYKSENFDYFKSFENLKSIRLVNTSIRSFEGISLLSKLEILKIEGAKLLIDFSEISSCNNIKKIFLSNCKYIYDISFVSKLESLEELHLENCGNIKTLDPIKVLSNLKRVYLTMSTKIEDGNMTLLIGKTVIVSHHKNYTHKCDPYNQTLIV